MGDMTPEEVEAQLQELKKNGNEAFKAGRMSEAVALFSMGIEIAPENEVLWSNRSGAYAAQGKFELALADAEEAIRVKPQWGRGYSRKAAALQGMGKERDALQFYVKALKLDPDNQSVKNSIEKLTMKFETDKEKEKEAKSEDTVKANQLKAEGNSAMKNGELDKAIELYTEAIKYQRDREQLGVLYSNRSSVYLLQDNYEKALQDAEKTVELRPNWVRGYTRRGAAFWQMGRLREARVSYTEALLYDSTNDELRKTVLKIEDQMKLEEQKKNNPDDPEIKALECKNKGNDALKAGDLEKAIEYYSEGIEYDPTNHILYSNRAAAYATLGNHEAALKDADSCIGMAPDFPKGYARKAAALEHLAQGDPKRLKGAVVAYLKAVEVDPDNEEWHDRALELEKVIEAKEEAARREDQKNVLGAMVVVEEKKKYQVAIVEEPEEQGDRKFEMEDFPGAIGWYTKALKKDPNLQHIYLKRGICWSKVRRFRKALADFDEALSKNEKDTQALWQKGNTLIKLAGAQQAQDPDAASEFFQEAVEVFEKGAQLDTQNIHGFPKALDHARNEQTAHDLTKDDRKRILERTRVRRENEDRESKGKLDWKSMPKEERERRLADMKRKREEAMFSDYLSKQMRRGRGKDVGIAQEKKRAKKYHTGVASKHTFTEDGI